MFKAWRIAARRASSRSSFNDNANNTSIQSTSAAAAAILLVIVNDRHNDNNNSDVNNKTAMCQQQAEEYNTYPNQSTQYTNNNSGHRPYRNFVQATSSTTQTNTSASRFHSGLMPPDVNDLRLRKAVTSKRMSAEQSRKTFFAAYEVQFDDPLGSGKLLYTFLLYTFLQSK